MVFQNSSLTVTSSLILIKKYQMRHKLTQEALSDLLQLMRLHFPTPNLLPPSLYLFNLLESLWNTHIFEVGVSKNCPAKMSQCVAIPPVGILLSGTGAISSFIEVPLEPQMLTLLQSMLIICTVRMSNLCLIYLYVPPRKRHIFCNSTFSPDKKIWIIQ